MFTTLIPPPADLDDVAKLKECMLTNYKIMINEGRGHKKAAVMQCVLMCMFVPDTLHTNNTITNNH